MFEPHPEVALLLHLLAIGALLPIAAAAPDSHRLSVLLGGLVLIFGWPTWTFAQDWWLVRRGRRRPFEQPAWERRIDVVHENLVTGLGCLGTIAMASACVAAGVLWLLG